MAKKTWSLKVNGPEKKYCNVQSTKMKVPFKFNWTDSKDQNWMVELNSVHFRVTTHFVPDSVARTLYGKMLVRSILTKRISVSLNLTLKSELEINKIHLNSLE